MIAASLSLLLTASMASSHATTDGPAASAAAAAGAAGAATAAAAAPAIPRPKPSGVRGERLQAEAAAAARSPVGTRLPGRCRLSDPARRWSRLPAWAREASLEAMIGQLLVVSFLGKTPGETTVQQTVQALADGRIGGVLYFGYNVGSRADVKALNQSFLQAHPRLPALIAIDQEGGAVSRLKENVGVPTTPRASEVAKGSAREAARTYGRMAAAMAELGFNVNLGPVVDLDIHPDNPVIGRFGRSYGRDPGTVAQFANAFVDAHRAAGIATALKHFPGHGSSAADSHDGAIDVTRSWSVEEVEPYLELIEAGRADMVMVGHLILDGLKGEGPAGLPATLSPALITGFLRGTLCFDGLVVSDDLRMAAIEKRWSIPQATAMSLAAGSDLILITVDASGRASLESIIAAVAAAARKDPRLLARIRDAYARVVAFKLALKSRRG